MGDKIAQPLIYKAKLATLKYGNQKIPMFKPGFY